MKTLVYVEHDNASMKDATLAVVTAAAQLGEVHALVAGHGCGAVAEASMTSAVDTAHCFCWPGRLSTVRVKG